MKSLMSEARIRPRIGWVRADQARSENDVQRERELIEELDEAKETIEELERIIRDGPVLRDEISEDSLAQGDEIVELSITFSDHNKILVSENIKLTWDEIFKVIGPTIYGYILRKWDAYGRQPKYPFQDNLIEHIRAKIIHRVQNRKINIDSSQIDACILQFKELGLLRFSENKKDNGEVFRGVTLTKRGERRLTLLSTRFRKTNTLNVTGPPDSQIGS